MRPGADERLPQGLTSGRISCALRYNDCLDGGQAMLALRPLFTSALLFAVAGTLRATEDVISVTTTITPGIPSTAEGYTFNNDQQAVTSITTGSNTYEVISAADNVFVRRNSVN